MAQIIDTIIQSETPPKKTNVLWDNGTSVMRFIDGEWQPIGGDYDKILEQINNNIYYLDKNKADKTEIPKKLSELEQDIEIRYDDTKIREELSRLETNKADKSKIPTKLSDLEQDIEIGSSYDDTEIRDAIDKKVDSDKVATINGLSLTNGGNIVIEGGGESYDDTEIREELSKKLEGEVVGTTTPTEGSIGGSYDDTEIRQEIAELSEGIAIRNVGAEDTDESVEEPDLPTPSASNEWKCVVDRRLLEGEKKIIFTTYADGTPLKAKELIVQILCDKVASTNINGYVTIHSSKNQTDCDYGAIDYEILKASETNPLLSQVHISASPFFTIAKIDRSVSATIATQTNALNQGGSMKAFQVYEDIVYVELAANSVLTSAAPYLKIYAR